MARLDPPPGYTSWNVYIEEQADLLPDQSIEARRLIKRDIKLGMIAAIDRQAGEDFTLARFRPYNRYLSPGTVSPDTGHPWLLDPAYDIDEQMLLETGGLLLQESGKRILL